jgi:hypothetical protein
LFCDGGALGGEGLDMKAPYNHFQMLPNPCLLWGLPFLVGEYNQQGG